MAKAKFERTKPHVNVGTIGHVDHGKTTLTAAITRCCREVRRRRTRATTRSTKAPEEGARHHDQHRARRVRDREPPLRARRLPGHADYVKNMITGAAQMDGAILVVSAPTARCRRPASTSCWRARWACRTSSCRAEQVRHGRRRRAARARRDGSPRTAGQVRLPGRQDPDHRGSALPRWKATRGNSASARSSLIAASTARSRTPERAVDGPS